MSVEPTDYAASGSSGGSKKSWVKWVALGCGGAIVLLVVFVVAVFFLVKTATAGPEEVVKNFLEAAGRGDYAAAHEHFSAPLKQVQPLEEFAAAAAANSMFFQVTDMTFNERSIDLSGASFSGTVTLEVGTTVPASFKLVKENGEWKLISYHIGS